MKILKLGQMLGGSNAPSGASAFANLYSLSFDGVDDYVDLGDADVFTPNNSGAGRGFSISFWTKIANSAERIINKSNIFKFKTLFHFIFKYNEKCHFVKYCKNVK